MRTDTRPKRIAKAVFGAVVLAAAVAAAVHVGLPKAKAPVSKVQIEREIGALPGFAGTLSLKFDGLDYNGQQAARIVAADVLVRSGAGAETVAASLEAAGRIIRDSIDVYQKAVVTGYARALDFEAGLAFEARAVWLAPELAAPLDGWTVLRLPDALRPPARALEGIYVRPTVVSETGGALVASVDLATEKRRRPAAGVSEILATPLIDCVDFDNAFERSPDLSLLEVRILSGGKQVARFVKTRREYEAADVSALLAALSKEVLKVSKKESALAEKYANTELFTPLLFDTVVSAEDKAEIKDLEARRREAESEFYTKLFAPGVWETSEE
jgi:hypothetical protein